MTPRRLAPNATVAVLGGTGVTGRAIVSELLGATTLAVRIGARQPERAKELLAAAPQRLQAVHADFRDPASLRALLSGCALLVNAAGPACDLEDRAALAALELGCHYLDLGGFDLLEARLAVRADRIQRDGLAFLLGAGWMPGLSGAFPMYVDSVARARFDRVDALRLYYGARDDWGTAAARDMLWSVFQDWSGEFRAGRWCRRSLFAVPPRAQLPAPFGWQRPTPFFDHQLRRFALRHRHAQCAAYVAELSGASKLLFLAVRIFSNPRSARAAQLIRRAIARDARRDGRDGLLYVQVEGERGGIRDSLAGVWQTRENHRIAACTVVAAVHALMEGRARAGLGYLCEAIEPRALVEAVAAQGFPYSLVDGANQPLRPPARETLPPSRGSSFDSGELST